MGGGGGVQAFGGGGGVLLVSDRVLVLGVEEFWYVLVSEKLWGFGIQSPKFEGLIRTNSLYADWLYEYD